MTSSLASAISVVIPSYNRKETIIDAIESALRQTIPPLEIIVVDDGSTDGSPELVSGLGDERVIVIQQPKNMGGAAARNAGIDRAKGDWVAFLDSDDLWKPEKCEQQLRSVQNRADAICYTNVEFFGGSVGRPYWNHRGLHAGERLSDYMIVDGQAVQTSSLLMPRHVAAAVKFDERLRRHQDWDFVLRAERSGFSFIYVDAPLVRYRLSDGASVSRNANVTATTDWMNFAGDMLDDRARVAINTDVILPRLVHGSRLKAMGIVLSAALSGHAGARRIASSVLHLMPQSLRDAVRKAKRAA